MSFIAVWVPLFFVKPCWDSSIIFLIDPLCAHLLIIRAPCNWNDMYSQANMEESSKATDETLAGDY